MDDFIRYYICSNYTPLGSAVLALLGAFIMKFKKNLPSRFLNIKNYFIGYFFSTLGGAVCHVLKIKFAHFPIYIFVHLIDYVFTFFEFYVIASFLKPDLSTKLFRSGSIIFYTSSGILFCLGFLAKTNENYFYLQTIFNIQAVIVSIFCFEYFKKFINLNPTQLQPSSFWIVTGISILMIGTLPFTLVSHHILLLNHPYFDDLFTIVYALYMIMFSVLIIGIVSHKSGTNLKSQNFSFNQGSF